MQKVAACLPCERIGLVLAGDCNLVAEQTEECTQKNEGEPDIRHKAVPEDRKLNLSQDEDVQMPAPLETEVDDASTAGASQPSASAADALQPSDPGAAASVQATSSTQQLKK